MSQLEKGDRRDPGMRKTGPLPWMNLQASGHPHAKADKLKLLCEAAAEGPIYFG